MQLIERLIQDLKTSFSDRERKKEVNSNFREMLSGEVKKKIVRCSRCKTGRCRWGQEKRGQIREKERKRERRD